MSEQPNLWIETPLILSSHLSALLDCNVYLKLENLQPSQSFKYRGISLFAQHCKATYGGNVHLIIASGGNAGLAAACAANHLGLKCTVYLPEGMHKSMISRLEKEKAEVIVIGKYYLEAAQAAERAVKEEKNACYVHGYEGSILCKGHGSMITEIARQLHEKPDAIFCSVGGGGLLGGIVEGCNEANWGDVSIVAVETHGAAAFYHSVSLNDENWHGDVSLPDGAAESYSEEHEVKLASVPITSKASSLAATSPSAPVVRAALQRKGDVICVTIPDEMAMYTTCSFAEDHKILAELACSTTLSVGYHPDLFRRVQQMHTDEGRESPKGRKNVVFIVCGGVKISIDEVSHYETVVRNALQQRDRYWGVYCNGERWDITMRQLDA